MPRKKPRRGAPRQKQTLSGWLVVFGIGCALYLTNLGGWDLWPSDEPRFGQIEREMLKTGEWLVPHVNNELYTDKPPLFFWAGAALAKINGGQVTAWTTRLPSALAAIGTLLLTYFLGARLFGTKAGFLAALALGTTYKFIDQARTAQTDMLMTIFATGACAVFAFSRFAGMKWMRAAAAFGLLTGLATLAKGPVGIVVPAGSIFLYFLAAREWGRVRWGAVALAVAAFVIAVGAWLGPMVLSIPPEARYDLLWHQNVTRYLEATHHAEPFWYFAARFPLGFLPMTILLPGLAMALWRESRNPGGLSRSRLYLLCWIAFTFLFFSFSSGKREQYILPLYPALALLLGDWVVRTSAERARAATGYRIAQGALGLCLAAAGVAALVGGRSIIVALGRIATGDAETLGAIPLRTAGAGLAVAGAIMALASRRGDLQRILHGFAGGMFALILTVALVIYPSMNPRRSARDLCDAISREWSEGEPVFSYDIYRAEYHLFGDYYLQETKDLDPIVRAFGDSKQVFCVLKKDDYPAFERRLAGASHGVIFDRSVGHRPMMVVTNRPAVASPGLIEEAQGASRAPRRPGAGGSISRTQGAG